MPNIKPLSTAEILMALNNGGAVGEIREALREGSRAVQQHGGKALVTLQFAITKNGDRGVQIVDSVTKRLPRTESALTFFFTDDDGSLFREDPSQMKFDEVSR